MKKVQHNNKDYQQIGNQSANAQNSDLNNEGASQKSFKLTQNFSNLEDSIGGIIGSSLKKPDKEQPQHA